MLRRQSLYHSGVVDSASGYDEDELKSAIAHAKSLARVAKKRVLHLRQEEALKNGAAACAADEMEEKLEELASGEMEPEELLELSEEELKQLMEELKQTMRELESEAAGAELSQELAASVSPEDLEPADLEQLKRKHRNQELREIMEADMKYLRALFDKLAREQKNSSGGCGSPESAQSSSRISQGGAAGQYDDISGVTLEISGAEVPVTSMELPAAAQGANMDVTV